MEVRINDGPWIKAIGTTSWNLSWDSTIVDDGGQTIHARSFDETDFSTEASVTVTVDNLPPQEPQDNWIWIVVGVVIVVVIILLALYLLIRRKKKEMELDESPEVESGN